MLRIVPVTAAASRSAVGAEATCLAAALRDPVDSSAATPWRLPVTTPLACTCSICAGEGRASPERLLPLPPRCMSNTHLGLGSCLIASWSLELVIGKEVPGGQKRTPACALAATRSKQLRTASPSRDRKLENLPWNILSAVSTREHGGGCTVNSASGDARPHSPPKSYIGPPPTPPPPA